MKNYIRILFAILALSILNPQLSTALAQGTAFTYQGQLQNNGSPAGGTYNLTFMLFATNSGGSPVAGPVTNNAVAVSNGLFTVTIDFGSTVWNGQTNWLQIAVSTNGANAFSTLAPRQQVTPTPYAVFAESANGLGGTVSALQLTSPGNTNGGAGNFFVGPSGNATTTGSFNTANGDQALNANTSGNFNTANGFQALYSNTSGSDNTADGEGTLLNNTSGSGNTANGEVALADNTNGSYNTANGFQALKLNTSGSDNTANGAYALFSNTSGTNNIALGFQAGINITTGSSNIDIGNPGVSGDNYIIRMGSGQDFDVNGTLNVNTGSYPGLTAFIRTRQTDNLALAVQGFDSVNYLVVYTNGQVNISGNCYALSFNPTSDRNAKKDFSSVNSGDVLAKVAALPITEWQYKADAPGIQHLGPMAQDFHAAFGLNGGDDKHISVVDEGGVALAAIQGLNQKLELENAELKQENNSLAKRLDDLEAEVKSLAQKN